MLHVPQWDAMLGCDIIICFVVLISYCDKFVQYHLQQNACAVTTHYNAMHCK